MEHLTIVKGNSKKKITQLAWDLQGYDHKGWEVVKENSHAVTNEVDTPPTGQADEKKVDNSAVENEVPKSTDTKPVDNEIHANDSHAVTNEALTNDQDKTGRGSPEEKNNSSESAPDDFEKFATEKLSRPEIKNYLDSKKILYKQNAPLPTLIGLLRTELLGSLDLLKSEFSINETL